jgi:metal-responsive CopG/Arc/MetJ family transcriptional regulator
MWIKMAIIMKTVQMTLDESLVEQVDRVAQSLGTTRSAFTRDALRGDWEDEQVWPDC